GTGGSMDDKSVVIPCREAPGQIALRRSSGVHALPSFLQESNAAPAHGTTTLLSPRPERAGPWTTKVSSFLAERRRAKLRCAVLRESMHFHRSFKNQTQRPHTERRHSCRRARNGRVHGRQKCRHSLQRGAGPNCAAPFFGSPCTSIVPSRIKRSARTRNDDTPVAAPGTGGSMDDKSVVIPCREAPGQIALRRSSGVHALPSFLQ